MEALEAKEEHKPPFKIWGSQQEGRDSKISGKEALSEHSVIVQYWTKLVRSPIPTTGYPGTCASPSHPLKLTSKSPRDTVRHSFHSKRKLERVLPLSAALPQLPATTGYTCPSTAELNQDKQLEPLALIHQNNQIFQKSVSGLAQCLTHSKL